MEPYQTLPQLLLYMASRFRNSCALNMRDEGTWHPLSTERFLETIRRLSLGLISLGLVRGQPVGVLAKSSPEWLMMDLAILSAGGISVPVFSNLSQEHFDFILKDAELKMLLVGDKQLLSYIDSEKHKYKSLIIYGSQSVPSDCTSWDQLLKLGDELSQKAPDKYIKTSSSIQPHDIATIIYTSGSTGVPKGVMLSHKNIVSQTHAARVQFPLNPRVDRVLSILPYAHVFERMLIYYYLSSGSSIYIVDDIRQFSKACQEVHPTVMAVVPRVLEKVYAMIKTRMQNASFLKKMIGEWAFSLAEKSDDSWWHKTQCSIANRTIYPLIRKALGGKIRGIISGGAALSADLNRFFLKVGIPVFQGYGLTETSPVIATNCFSNYKVGTVGRPIIGVEVKISETGEILTKGPNVMQGYHKLPDQTKEVINDEGWFHTGDLGMIDEDGHLIITGRIKELFKTSSGKQVRPIPIELELQKIPWVETALILADERPFVSVLLIPDFDVLEKWKKKLNKSLMEHEEFLDCPEVTSEMKTSLANVNNSLDRWEQIKEYRFIPRPLSLTKGEITPTLKVRRHIIYKNFSTLIDQIYGEA